MGIIITGYGAWMSGYSRGDLVIAALVWTIGGIAVGRIRWAGTEQRYQRFQADRVAPGGRPGEPRAISSRLLRGRRRSLSATGPSERFGVPLPGEGSARPREIIRCLS